MLPPAGTFGLIVHWCEFSTVVGSQTTASHGAASISLVLKTPCAAANPSCDGGLSSRT
jgi:hypothetical protein